MPGSTTLGVLDTIAGEIATFVHVEPLAPFTQHELQVQ